MADITFFPYIHVAPQDYRWRAQAGDTALTFILPRSFVDEGLHAMPVLGNMRLVLDYGKVIRPACKRAFESRGGIRVDDHLEITLAPQDLRQADRFDA